MEFSQFLGQPVPTFSHPQSKKMCLLMFTWNLLCFSLCPLPLIMSLGTTEKSLNTSSLHPSFRYLYTCIRILVSVHFHFSRLDSPSSLREFICEVPQSLNHPCHLLLDCFQYLHVSFVLRSPEELGSHNTPVMVSPMLNKKIKEHTTSNNRQHFSKVAKSAFSFPSSKSIVLAQVELCAHQYHHIPLDDP